MQPVSFQTHDILSPRLKYETQEKVSQENTLTISSPSPFFGGAAAIDVETKARDFVVSALKVEQGGLACPVSSTDGSTSSKPGSVLWTQNSKIKDCAFKNFRGKEGCFSSSVHKAFADAVNQRIADKYTRIATIDAYDKNGQFAEQKRASIDDEHTS
jgi:hypothetical protein